MKEMNFMISSTEPYADISLCNALSQNILHKRTHVPPLVFFCIGTTQVTGDSLGPLTGSQLEQLHLPNTTIYGTWNRPVHALNLEHMWENAKKKHPDSCFIAIDASFGPKIHLGNICVECCPIYPGQGVGKSLPAVGDISITGIVCPNCIRRHDKLAKIPFSLIQHQSNIITNGIFQTLFHFFILRKP